MDTTGSIKIAPTKVQKQIAESQTAKNNDIHRRRYINCGNSKNLQDYITRAELLKAFPNWSGHV